ncbi:hypothetical protein PV327_000101 [Microctonus hyperodae]|uniref:Uncharacterized protein n=1 Tax=Microctonus hyperodae TaxID=165561 RepID=A0AA39G5I0_MICHY|nr:hypothetical protein PV327_000101 [Microctonus hyperodae]
MKLVYVELVVLFCVLQILIGSSNKLPNARNCSTITCGDNERCKEFDDKTLSCICSPNYYRNNNTEKCESLKYQWVNYTPELWNDTRLVHPELPYHYPNYIITRIIYKNYNQVPHEGRIDEIDKTIEPYPPIIIKNYKQIEVLLVKNGDYKWMESSNGKVEKNAIEGGKINNEKVYVCRAEYEEQYYSGVMLPSDRACYLKIADNFYPTYELLILLKYE